MKYSTVLLLLLGTISHADAIVLEQKQAPIMPVKKIEVKATPPKALAQVAIQAEHVKPVKKINLGKSKEQSMIQVKSDNEQNRHFSIENKVKNNQKAEQLQKMEQALKQATEEAHKQRMAISGTSTQQMSSKLVTLQISQQKEQADLKQKLEKEEESRLKEAKQNELYAMKVDSDELDHRNQELIVQQRAEQMKLLQAEEAIQKIEAEREEQEFLEAQAKQDIKAAQAKKAAQKANIARIKRKHELQRRSAEQKLKIFKMEKQAEAEALIEQENSKAELAKISGSLQAEKQQNDEIAKAKKETAEAQEAEAKAKKEIEVAKDMKEKAMEKSANNKEIEEKVKAEIKAKAEEKVHGEAPATKNAEKESKVSVTEKFAKEKDVEKTLKISEKPVDAKAKTEVKSKGGASAAVEEITKSNVKASVTDEMNKMIDDHKKIDKKIDAAHAGKADKVKKELSDEIDNFSVSLSDKHYMKAVQLRQQLLDMGVEEPRFTVHAKDTFRKMFTFPQIANNDYALDLFEQLENTETNLAQNPDNEVMKENFVKTSVYVATQLKDRYGDQWINPRDNKEDDKNV